jgi:hypothetical protein
MTRKLLLLAPFLIISFSATAQQTHTVTGPENSLTPETNTVNVVDQAPATGTDDGEPGRGKLYPVPAIDHIIYESPGTVVIDEIRILDITGRPVIQMKRLEQPSGQFKIDVSGLNKGMYIIRIRSGESTIIKKFLKS